MRKLITENPQSMVEHMHNFVCVKNREVYVRLDEKEINLVDFIRQIDKELYGIEHDDEYCNAEEFAEYMDEDRFTCIMYHALVGFAEVREKLKYYEENLGELEVKEILENNSDNKSKATPIKADDLKVFSFENGEKEWVIAMCMEEAKCFYASLIGFEEMEECTIEEEENWHDIKVNCQIEDEDTGIGRILPIPMIDIAKEMYPHGYNGANVIASTCI